MWSGREVEPHNRLPYLATPNTSIGASDIRLILEGGDIPQRVIDFVGDLISAGGTLTQVLPTAVATALYS